ncbi:hypothetical protein B9T54_03790 [Leptospira borgpetersenii serovar Hardjo-bovis]|nr:hypothetical protein B9T54_03790 [Leptospira borgpetersenii serovar Hardjo-bovis]
MGILADRCNCSYVLGRTLIELLKNSIMRIHKTVSIDRCLKIETDEELIFNNSILCWIDYE